MRCTACDKELNKKEVVYTEDNKAYCPNPFQCNENHPNSVQNILARGAAVKLYTEDELEENIFDRLHITEAMKDRILKVATKPQSIRLSKYDVAHYLLALQEEEDMTSISEAVRFCVHLAMRVRPLDRNGEIIPQQPKGEPTPEPEPIEVIKVIEAKPTTLEEVQAKAAKSIAKSNGIKFVVPDVPKSVNVDWSKVEKAPVEEKKDEEEEFTF
jgi:hypothetical protein